MSFTNNKAIFEQIADRLADEIILIANGEIAGRGTADELYPKLLSQTVAGCNLLEVNGIC